MASPLNNKNEYIAGYMMFKETKNWGDFDIFGSVTDDTVVLKSLSRHGTSHPDNIDINYYGGLGTDTLEYEEANSNGTRSVTVVGLGEYHPFDLYLEGGYGTGYNGTQLDSLQIFTLGVEIFDLTNNDDTVNLSSGSSNSDLTFYGGGGDDVFYGSNYADTFYGEAKDDFLEGRGGDDYLNGGTGDDILLGGEGNDTLLAGTGADTVSGGRGNDIIYASADLNSDGISIVYGDWVNVADSDDTDGNSDDRFDADDYVNFAPESGVYNSQDVFFIGYDTTVSVDNSSDNSGFFSPENIATGSDVLGEIGSAAIMAAGYGNFAGAAVSVGFSIGSSILSNLINSGKDASAGELDNTDNQVVIKDFDAWADTAVIALDDFDELLSASVVTDVTDGTTGRFNIGTTEFLKIALATSQVSIMEDETASLNNLNTEKEAILENLLKNSLVVWKGDDLSTTEYDYGSYAKTMNGTDLILAIGDTNEQTLLDTYLSGGSDGVWILGDYGNSFVFGHSLDALAGSNSNNIMYSGTFKQGDSAAWFSDSSISMYGGEGNDALFGSTDSEDKLYGGSGNDYLHGVTNLFAGTDELYGGSGYDFASFTAIIDEDSDVLTMKDIGIFADLSTVRSDGFSVAYELSAADARTYKKHDTFDTTNDKVAYLEGIEALEGSAYDDVLIGDDGDNILIGGDGWDIVEGGGGSDTFVFLGADADGTTTWWERILDFDISEDVIQLENTADRSFDELRILYNDTNDATIINYGNGSIRLYGDYTPTLTEDHFIFA